MEIRQKTLRHCIDFGFIKHWLTPSPLLNAAE
jgi:hypothetical protein